MICQVSLFSRFLLLLSIPQTKPSNIVITRLFFRPGKDQKSPSFIPVDFTEIEVPEDGLESDSIDDIADVADVAELSDHPVESLDLVDSGDLTGVDGTEVEWDQLAKESLDDLPTTERIIAPQKLLDSNEESADVVVTGADGADGEDGADGVDIVVTPQSVAEDIPTVEDVKDVVVENVEEVEEVAIAENQVSEDIEDIADETLDTSEDQDVGETEEESDPVADEVAEVEAVADDIEEVADAESEESEQEELEIRGDTLETEPNLLSQVESGYYTVDATGKVEFSFIFDSGAYQGQLAAISMTGMENLDLNSPEFFQEALQRALSGSEAKLGYIVIDDISAGAMFSGELELGFDYNHGEFAGSSIVEFTAGDKFFLMLIPNGSVAEVEEALEQGIAKDVRPLFSLVAANSTKAIQMGQIVDVTGDGNTYVFEDIRQDGASDKDFNDLIFQVKGATITTVTLDELILEGEMSPEADWRNTEIGQQIVDYAASQVVIVPEPNPVEKYEFPKEDQPLVGFIDTHFTQGNPDIDYSRIIFGKDYIQNDSDPTVVAVAGEGTHGDHILGIVAATQDNSVGIDGINDDAPLWVSSAVESGKWADALVEFVDAVKASNQPNAIINLSIDLTQVNPDGSVTTRYEFTPQERGAIEYARQNGVLIVAAAGNDGGVMSVLGQASQEFDNIITVGSSDGLTRAEYSSYGQGLGILAPGGTASNPELSLTGDSIGLMSGTSVATAKVTGAASQVWAANPELSYRQVIEILKSTATDLSTPGWDAETGAGLLNMVAAVQAAKITVPVVHKPKKLLIPTTWGGKNKVKPIERPVDIKNAVFDGIVKSTNGINLRYDTSLDAKVPGEFVNYQQSLTFTGWKYGQTLENLPYGNYQGGDLDAMWFRYERGGQIYWIPSAFIYGSPPGNNPPLPTNTIPDKTVGYDGSAIHTTYVNTFNKNGGTSNLGTPTNNVHPWENGYTQDFSGGFEGVGAIMKSNANDNSYWVGGEFWRKFLDLGGAGGNLGYPTSDRYPISNGWRQDFQGKSIVMVDNSNSGGSLPNPSSTIIDNFTIAGSFYSVWQQNQGTLGNPIENVQNHGGGTTYQRFNNGSIVSSNYGTFPLYGAIRQAYLNRGGLDGRLGVPTSGEVGQGNGVIKQTFERGHIIWNGSQATVYEDNSQNGQPLIVKPSPSPVRLYFDDKDDTNKTKISWSTLQSSSSNNIESKLKESYKRYPYQPTSKSDEKPIERGLVDKWWYAPDKIRIIDVPDSKNYGIGIYNENNEKQLFIINGWAQTSSGEYWLRSPSGKWLRAKDVEPLGGSFTWEPVLKVNLPTEYIDLISAKWDNIKWEEQSGDGYQFNDPKMGANGINESDEVIKKVSDDLMLALLGEKDRYMSAGYAYETAFPYNGKTSAHAGIDYSKKGSGNAGDKVQVVVPGIVVQGGYQFDEKGNDIGYFATIKAGDGKLWIYGHIKPNSVITDELAKEESKRQTLGVGTAIGNVFNQAGNSHLHIEVSDTGTDIKGILIGNHIDKILKDTISPLQAYWQYRINNS